VFSFVLLGFSGLFVVSFFSVAGFFLSLGVVNLRCMNNYTFVPSFFQNGTYRGTVQTVIIFKVVQFDSCINPFGL